MCDSGRFLPVIAVAGLCVIAAFKVPWCYSQIPPAGNPADYTNSEVQTIPTRNRHRQIFSKTIRPFWYILQLIARTENIARAIRYGCVSCPKSRRMPTSYINKPTAMSTRYFQTPAQRENRIEATKWVDIPSVSDLFNWQISEPFGEEVIKVIAAKEPIEGLDDPALRKKRFNEVGAADLKRVTAQLMSNDSPRRPAWAEDHVKITTLPRGETQPAAEGKRFGVFFGISKYEFNDVAHEMTQGKWHPNLDSCAKNAAMMKALMHSLGKLDDVKLFVDEQATRRQMEVAITQWLPSVSRPGDTVFIFFSGHGDQIIDDNDRENGSSRKQEEPDGKDEWLLTHDYVDGLIYAGLKKRHDAGKLDSTLQARFARLEKLVQRAVAGKKNQEQAVAAATSRLARNGRH